MTWAPAYATGEELAAYVRITDDVDAAQLELATAAASRAIDRACRRQFGQDAAPVARYYTAKVDPVTGRPAVDIDDLMTSVGLLVELDTGGDGTYATELTGVTLKPRNAPASGEPWTWFTAAPGSPAAPAPGVEDAVRVTARFGWAEVPRPIHQACLLQASRLLARRDAPFGVAGSPDSGSEVRLLARLDPDVDVLLGPPYRRRWWAV